VGSVLDLAISVLRDLSGDDVIVASFYSGLFVAMTTTLGSVPVLARRKGKDMEMTLSLAFAAGVMLVASFTSLILPALEMTDFYVVGVGILLGVLTIFAVDRLIPHEHFLKGYEGPEHGRRMLKRIWLIAMAMLIHNLPEGLAVGTTMAYSVPVGVATAVAIGVQDMPEGLAVALPVAELRGRWMGFVIGALSGLSEMIMVLVGASLFSHFKVILPLGMAFSGGAMLYVTLKEAIPEIYGEGSSELKATIGLLAGFYLMLFLDSML